ncbi:MAG TPA: hypothetical protein PLS00_00265 [Niabella sp.]|jgi:hypothetical protein|nr:hypothetical protein [Niabella sp.]
MNTAAIRDKLYDYIRVADDKKLMAIYTMLEDTIREDLEWWRDNVVVEELQKRYEAWDSGKEKGYSMADIDEDIARLKKKRASK